VSQAYLVRFESKQNPTRSLILVLILELDEDRTVEGGMTKQRWYVNQSFKRETAAETTPTGVTINLR